MEGRRIYVKHSSYLENELFHYNVEGSKWGRRLYQNKDGSLTPLGRIHYGIGQARAKRAEQAAAYAKKKAEQESENNKKKYQNKDGTLKLRGKIHYRTTDKYALLSDDEIRQQTNRLQLQKNLDDMKRQTSSFERLKSKMGNTLEDVTVSGFRKGAEKLVNHFVDQGVSKILKTDKENVTTARELAGKLAGMTTKEIKAMNERNKAEKEAYERITGEKLPKDYKFSDLVDSEKAGIKKDEKPESSESKPEREEASEKKTESSESKPEREEASEKKTESSESKPEREKPSEKKSEEKSTVDSSEISKMKAMARSGDSLEEIADKMDLSPSTISKYVNVKEPVMKEAEEKKSRPPLKRHHAIPEEITKPYARVHRVDSVDRLKEVDEKKTPILRRREVKDLTNRELELVEIDGVKKYLPVEDVNKILESRSKRKKDK